ncbi:MAG: DUF559 domain-containing protein [Chloroflexota bacterium]|nr:DUF559 domain-containing protein [Dehalococcoidia bacterium]MDW8252536.1 DUF559 domain-containing protein [Chloroflexota bacterium]
MPPTNRIRRFDPPRAAVRARELRRSQSPVDARFWAAVRNRPVDGLKCRRQHPIGPSSADFVCAAARARFLEGRGYRVRRFTNAEEMQAMGAVGRAILAAGLATEREGPPARPHRAPLPHAGATLTRTLSPKQEREAWRINVS